MWLPTVSCVCPDNQRLATYKQEESGVCKCGDLSHNPKRRQQVAGCLQLWEYIFPLSSMQGLMKTLEITTFRFDTSNISGGRETGKILLTLWEMNTVGGVSLSYGQRRKSQCLVYHGKLLLWASHEGEGHAFVFLSSRLVLWRCLTWFVYAIWLFTTSNIKTLK